MGSTGRVGQCVAELLFFLLLHVFDRVSSVERTNRITDTGGSLDGAHAIEEVKKKEEEQFGNALADPSSAAH